MFKLWAATVLASGISLAVPLSAQVLDGSISAAQKSGDWTSLRLALDKKRYARAMVNAPNGNILALDYALVSDCIVPFVSVLIPLEAEAESSVSTPYSGFFRVDQRPTMAFEGTMSKTTGDNMGILVIERLGDVKGFLLSLTDGRTLRLQIGEVNSVLTERFSLSGARQAMVRAMDICRGR